MEKQNTVVVPDEIIKEYDEIAQASFLLHIQCECYPEVDHSMAIAKINRSQLSFIIHAASFGRQVVAALGLSDDLVELVETGKLNMNNIEQIMRRSNETLLTFNHAENIATLINNIGSSDGT